MKKGNKKIAAGTMLCALASTGLRNVQVSANESNFKKAAKECRTDIVKTGLAITGGALAVDKLSGIMPRTTGLIGKLGKLAIKPVKWMGEQAIKGVFKLPEPVLVGGAAILIYAACTISKKALDIRVDEKVKENSKNKSGNDGSNSVTININNKEDKVEKK